MTTDDLIEDIKKNRCILFMGPLMSTFEDESANWISHTELYCRHLQSELKRINVPFDATALSNPYYLATKYFNTCADAQKNDADFINEVYKRDSALYKKLSVIPFNTIINFGFDHYMNRALEEAGYEYTFTYYHYKGPEVSHINADKDIQLVYNLFGSIDEPMSRILTEKNQLEFLRKINSSPKLPDDLLSRVKEDMYGPKSYIFLGFNFEEWPFRFLLDTLEVPKASRSVTLNPAQTNIAIMTHDFYQDRFGIDFLNQSAQSFMTELIDKYTKSVITHKYGFITYVDQEEEEVKQFREPADIRLELMRGISIWDKSKLKAGENIETATAENLQKATIYIPFISNRSIIDPVFREEVNTMINRSDVLIFPIINRVCLWKNVFKTLESRASAILPGKDDVLISSSKQPAEEDYLKIIKIINSKIR